MRIVVAGVCLFLYLFPTAAAFADDDPSAWDLYEQGREAEKAGHYAKAYLFYAEAAAKDPNNHTYWQHSLAIRTRAALEGLVMPEATTAAAEPVPEEPSFKPEEATARDKWDALRKSSPVELKPDDGTGDIDLRGDSKQLWQQLAKVFGLEAIFDADYQALPPIRFRLKDVDYQVAMRGLEAATGSFIVPVTSQVFMVVKDTPQKRTEMQPRVAVSIPLADSVSQQEFNLAVTAVQQSVGIEKISFDTQERMVIMRDTLAKVTAARALFQELIRPPAQILVELKMIEVTRNDMLTYGIDFPTLFSLNYLTNWLGNQLTPPSGISGLLTFGEGKTLMGLSFIAPAIVAQLSKATSSNLLESQLRTTDGVAATMHIGEQYPVMTSQYVGPSNFTTGGTVYTPPPSFQFVDLGLTLKVTPSIRSLDSATLDIDAEYKVLSGDSVNNIPIIGNRALKSNINLKMGEWAVIGGLLDVEQAHSIAGLAGASRIPYLNALTSTHTKTNTTDEILLLVRPVPLSLPPSEVDPGRAVWMGSETRPITLL